MVQLTELQSTIRAAGTELCSAGDYPEALRLFLQALRVLPFLAPGYNLQKTAAQLCVNCGCAACPRVCWLTPAVQNYARPMCPPQHAAAATTTVASPGSLSLVRCVSARSNSPNLRSWLCCDQTEVALSYDSSSVKASYLLAPLLADYFLMPARAERILVTTPRAENNRFKWLVSGTGQGSHSCQYQREERRQTTA